MTASNSNNTTHDAGVDEDPAANARFPLIISVYVPAFFISEFGNAFVIYSLVYLKRRQRTTVDNYILNLAIGDFLITTLSLFNAVEYLKNEWRIGEAMCKIHGQAMEALYTSSTLTLLVVSYNRRKVASGPLKLPNARKSLKRNIALIWFAAIALTSPLAYAYTVAMRNNRFHCSNTNFDKMPRSIYYLLQAVILFFVPVAIMIESQRTITKGLRQHSVMYKANMDCKNAHWRRVMGHERKVGKFLTWIWVVFVLCFTPHIIMRTINHFTSLRASEIWNQVWHISQLLALLNSAINPFLYYRTTNRDAANVSCIVRLFCFIRQSRSREVASKQRSSAANEIAVTSGSLLNK